MPTYPSGSPQATIVSRVQARTNARFGQPSNADVVGFLNEGIEQVVLKTEPIITSVALAITVPNTTSFVLPADIGRIRNVAYATGVIGVPGVSVYPLEEVPFDQYLAVVQAVPVGSIGGIASMYTVTADASNQMTILVYPLVSAGYLYLYYYQRPQLWDPANPNSVSTLDSAFEEPVKLWACARTCEAIEDLNRAKWFQDQFLPALEEAKADVFKRTRKNQSNIVQDVSAGASVWPSWVRG